MRFKSVAYLTLSIFTVFFIMGCASTKPPMEGQKKQITGTERPIWIDNPRKEDTKKEKAFAG